jgi:phosphatidylserine decarboxylase
MSEQLATEKRRPLQPMDPRITSIQPGGGFCMALELAWGRWRRWYLRCFRPGYVQRMAAVRRHDPLGCPHEVLDPRDVKFYRNLTGDCWSERDDPFAWREHLPLARVGLAEVVVGVTTCALLGALLAWFSWPLAILPLGLGLFVAAFFCNPRRSPPADPGVIVAPADGRVVSIDELAHDEFIDGPAVVIGIFLSVFNVHINRSPVASRVIGLTYSPGKFLNALRSQSARENEQLALRLEQSEPPHRPVVV